MEFDVKRKICKAVFSHNISFLKPIFPACTQNVMDLPGSLFILNFCFLAFFILLSAIIVVCVIWSGFAARYPSFISFTKLTH